MIIPGIEGKINKRLKKLEIRPLVYPNQFIKEHGKEKHRFLSYSLTKEKKPVLFYARLHDNLDAKEKMKREIRFLNSLKKSNLKIKSVIPAILRSGIEKDFEWLEREYVEGLPLKPPFSSSFLNSLEKTKNLTRKIFLISKTDQKKLPGANLKKFDHEKYLEPYLHPGLCSDLLKKGIITKKEVKEVKKINSGVLQLLKKENRFLSHNDLNPGNILLEKSGKIWIIDWELVLINNPAYDIAYLWSHLWREKKSRKNLIDAYLKNLPAKELTRFKKLFPLATSYLALGGAKLRKKGEKESDFKKKKSFYLKVIKNSFKNFKELINT